MAQKQCRDTFYCGSNSAWTAEEEGKSTVQLERGGWTPKDHTCG